MWIRTPNPVTKVQDGTHKTSKTALVDGDLLTRQDKATLAIKHETSGPQTIYGQR